MSNEVQPSDSTNSTCSDDVIGVARLLQNIKENNVTYLVAILVAFQMGILDKVWTYGSGMC